MWSAIHGLPAFGRDVEQIKTFYEGLAVPCSTCQEHLDAFRVHNPVRSIQSREGALLWGLRLHNSVNKKLGKKEYTMNECWDTHCSSVPRGGGVMDSFTDSDGHVFLTSHLTKKL